MTPSLYRGEVKPQTASAFLVNGTLQDAGSSINQFCRILLRNTRTLNVTESIDRTDRLVPSCRRVRVLVQQLWTKSSSVLRYSSTIQSMSPLIPLEASLQRYWCKYRCGTVSVACSVYYCWIYLEPNPLPSQVRHKRINELMVERNACDEGM